MKFSSLKLKQFLLIQGAGLALVAVIGSASMLYIVGQIEDASLHIGQSTESTRIAARLKADLLEHSRESLLLMMTGKPHHLERREAARRQIQEDLDSAEPFVNSREEVLLLNSIQSSLEFYFKERERLEKTNVPPARIADESSRLVDGIILKMGQFADLNLDQARTLLTQVHREHRKAEILWGVVLVSTLSLIFFLWTLGNRFLYRPIRELEKNLREFQVGSGKWSRPLSAIREIEDAGLAYDSMAHRLESQRDTQLRYLASVAHDLKNPINAMKMSTELLEPRTPQDREILSILGRQTDHLHRLVDDLLEVTRIEAGDLELRRQEVDLGDLVRETARLFDGVSGRHSVHLHLPSGKIMGHVDPERMRQVLNNLLSNAIKYSPDGGPVLVSMTTESGRVRICVQDHGLGIPEADLQRIFEPFQRSSATKLQVQGVGLGLSTSRKIVESHGGRIEVSSQLGKGSRFELTVPVSASTVENPSPRDPPEPPGLP